MTGVPAFEVGVWNGWIFIAVFVVYMGIMAMIFKVTDKLPDDKQIKNIVWIGIPLILLMAVYSIFLPLVRGTGWFYVGSVVFLIGLIVFALSRSEAEATPDGKPFTGSVYRYSRHPIYMSYFLVFLGTGIASASWLFMLLSVVLLVLLCRLCIREESMCVEKFGESYQEYMKRAPRWIGFPKSD